MAVPKRKTPRSRTHSRRSANMKLALPAKSICPQCGAAKLPHRVCGNCGHYRGRQVIDVD
ncbi:MAG: 50S ribosomal protein L32 [Actinomycetota bacterium]|jgi:large subunit ribosomal protein L32|nr:50S ribosomal protein L32 [Actinomycetota bacterium]